MSLTSNANGADRSRTAGWRLVVASVATRRTLALVTAFAAALGLLPLYESVWWWDLLTHTLSGAVITCWLLLERWRVGSVLVVVALLTGAWELAEYATPNYVFVAGGAADTALDAACNFVGAAAVAAGFGVVRGSVGASSDGGGARRANRSEPRTGRTDD